MSRLRETSVAVAAGVARAAVLEGVAQESLLDSDNDFEARIQAAVWKPVLPPIDAV